MGGGGTSIFVGGSAGEPCAQAKVPVKKINPDPPANRFAIGFILRLPIYSAASPDANRLRTVAKTHAAIECALMSDTEVLRRKRIHGSSGCFCGFMRKTAHVRRGASMNAQRDSVFHSMRLVYIDVDTLRA